MARENRWGETFSKLDADMEYTDVARGAEDFVPITARTAVTIPLDVIAREIRTMPFGDMIELSKAYIDSPTNEQLYEIADRLWAWAQKRG